MNVVAVATASAELGRCAASLKQALALLLCGCFDGDEVIRDEGDAVSSRREFSHCSEVELADDRHQFAFPINLSIPEPFDFDFESAIVEFDIDPPRVHVYAPKQVEEGGVKKLSLPLAQELELIVRPPKLRQMFKFVFEKHVEPLGERRAAAIDESASDPQTRKLLGNGLTHCQLVKVVVRKRCNDSGHKKGPLMFLTNTIRPALSLLEVSSRCTVQISISEKFLGISIW